MLIKDVLDRKGTEVVAITPDQTVQDAIRKLCEKHIGALVVSGDDGELTGIVTERDIMEDCGYQCSQLEELAHPGEAKCPRLVKDIMTTEVIIGVLDDRLDYVMGIMTQNRIRHLPVLDEGKVAGIVSIGDVVEAHLSEATFENRFLKDYIQGRLL